MRRVFAFSAGLCLATAIAHAAPDNNSANADDAWQSLKDKGNPVVAAANTRTQVIATYLADADALKDFYTKNPNHAAAKEAKRREALSLLNAETLGEKSQKGRVKQLVKDLRQDTSLDVELREQVAAFSDNLDIEESIPADARLAAYEQTARALQAEFPTSDGVYEGLNGVGFSSPDDRAAAIARDIQTMPASDPQKARAQLLLARLALKGTSLVALADATLGANNVVDAANGHPILVYSWSSTAPRNLALVKSLVGSLPTDTVYIGVCLDFGDLTAARAKAAAAQVPGQQLFDSMGMMSRFAGRAYFTHPGLIYLADRQGLLVSVSGHRDTAAIVTAAANL